MQLRGTGHLQISAARGSIIEVLVEPYVIPYFTAAAVMLILIILCIFPLYYFLEECCGSRRAAESD